MIFLFAFLLFMVFDYRLPNQVRKILVYNYNNKLMKIDRVSDLSYMITLPINHVIKGDFNILSPIT